MRTGLLVSGLLVLGPYLTSHQDVEAVIKENLKLMGELTGVLKSIKDKATAEAALPMLKPIDERLAVQAKKTRDLKLSAEEKEQLEPKYKASFETVTKALLSEVERIDQLPEAKALLVKELILFKQIEEEKVAIAKVQIKTIDFAISVYQARTDLCPKSLKALTEGEKPALSAEALIDPWKKPYQYDPVGPKNKGKRPDVWTVTPNKKVIGNWEE